MTKKRILGIDPGTTITGYGLIEANGSSIKAIDYGCVKPPASLIISQRYLIIYRGICSLIKKYSPDALAVETQYVHRNIASAMKLGMARGMVILAAAENDIPIFEYAPTQAKLAAVGKGNASKHQVQAMLVNVLGLKSPPQPEDAADALAIALCHMHASSNGTQI